MLSFPSTPLNFCLADINSATSTAGTENPSLEQEFTQQVFWDRCPVKYVDVDSSKTTMLDFFPGTPDTATPPLSDRFTQIITEESSSSFGSGELRYQIHELVGQGGFGSVYRCSLMKYEDCRVPSESTDIDVLELSLSDSGGEFAVKVVDAQRIALLIGVTVEEVMPRLLREAEVLRMLGTHPHIVTLHLAFYSKESHKLYLLYEFLRGGDLFSEIVRRRKPFGEPEARCVFTQLAQAVAYGHEKGIAHRDLKLDNCLIVDPNTLSVKVCDYGQAIFVGLNACAKTLTSAGAYTAPDVHRAVRCEKPYDPFKADAYSLGVLLYGLLCSALPNAAKGSAYQDHKSWQFLSHDAQDLVQQLLVENSSRRLSVKDALAHPWLAGALAHGSKAASISKPLPNNLDIEVRCLLAVHQVVVALQRERGVCLWACGTQRFEWQIRYTNERFAEMLNAFEVFASSPNSSNTFWSGLRTSVATAFEKIHVIRAEAKRALEGSMRIRAVDLVLDAYSRVVSVAIEALATMIERSSCCSGVFNGNLVKHRLLVLTSEQLGRERALLCGHLHQPACDWELHTARRVNQVIGARKLLLGTSAATTCEPTINLLDLDSVDPTAIPSAVVAGETGLLPSLCLMDAPLLDAEELAQLEDAEDRALNLSRGVAPELAEWYVLLTRLIDKVHQYVIMDILERFPSSLLSE